MRFRVKLNINTNKAVIPLSYQYPLSAAIYRILESADVAYATFLHDTGYRQEGSLKSFKLFTFSDINTPFAIQGDRMLFLTPNAELEVSFHLPQAAENFIRGLFLQQQIVIADKRSRAVFTVAQVEALSISLSTEGIQEVILQPQSAIVCGLKNEKGNYDFLSPEHPEFTSQLIYNWKEKYKAVYGAELLEEAFADSAMEVMFYKNPPKSRLITVKADTPAETKIRGFTNFRLKIRGKKDALELLLNCGVGLYNSLGMGNVGIENK